MAMVGDHNTYTHYQKTSRSYTHIDFEELYALSVGFIRRRTYTPHLRYPSPSRPHGRSCSAGRPFSPSLPSPSCTSAAYLWMSTCTYTHPLVSWCPPRDATSPNYITMHEWEMPTLKLCAPSEQQKQPCMTGKYIQYLCIACYALTTYRE